MLISDAGHGSSSVQAVDLGWLDAPDRRSTLPEATLQVSELDPQEVQALAIDLKSVLSAEIIMAPAAIGGHFDHRLVNAAVSSTVSATRIVFYEDLPYAARLANGQQSHPFRDKPFLLLPTSQPQNVDRKRDYAMCYPSQVDQATAQEISNYTSGLGGREKFYGLMPALEGLRRLTP